MATEREKDLPRACPKLSGTFEPALPLPACRFHRPGPNRPSASGPFPILHPPGLVGKVALIAPHGFSRFSRWCFQLGQFLEQLLFLAVPELMPVRFDPARHRRFVCAMESLPQGPQMLAGMVDATTSTEPATELSDVEVKALKYIVACCSQGKSPTVRGVANVIGKRSSRSGMKVVDMLLKRGLIYRNEKGQLTWFDEKSPPVS